MDVSGILALLGGIAIFVSLFGGGIEIERLKIPVVTRQIRFFSALTGVSLISLAIWISNPQILQPSEASTASTSMPSLQPKQNLSLLDDFNEDNFNEEKWQFEWLGGDVITYSIEQSNGRACFKFINNTNNYREFVVASKFSGKVDFFEADISAMSGDGEFGLDMNDGKDWYNLLINGNGQVRIAYGSFDTGGEMEYLSQSIRYDGGAHKLSVDYGPREARFQFDDLQLWSRPTQAYLLNYGFDVRVNANSELVACVDNARVRFVQ